MVANLLVGVLVTPPSYNEVFESLSKGVTYLVTFQNPLISVLAILILVLLCVDTYKKKTSKNYEKRSTKVRTKKIFGPFEIQYIGLKDTLIFFVVAIGSFAVIFLIFANI